MKIFGERVLVKQIMKKRKSLVITPGGATNPDQFDVTQEVTMLSPDYDRGQINVGDIPIFSRYANLGDTKVIKKTEDYIETDIIVHVDDIIGIDDPGTTGTATPSKDAVQESEE